MGQDRTKVGRYLKHLQKNGMSFMDAPTNDCLNLVDHHQFLLIILLN